MRFTFCVLFLCFCFVFVLRFVYFILFVLRLFFFLLFLFCFVLFCFVFFLLLICFVLFLFYTFLFCLMFCFDLCFVLSVCLSFLDHFKWPVFHILLHSLIFKAVGNQTSACSLPKERPLSHQRAHSTIVVISRLRLLIVVGNNLHKTMHLRRHCLVVGTAPAKDGLASNTVFSGLIVAWFFAESPMRRSPEPASHATYDGVIRLPWSFGRISTRPFFYTPTQEYGSLTTVNYIINLFDNIV